MFVIRILLILKQTESIEEASRIKYPLHLAGTALQLFQLATTRGLGKEPDVAILRIWDSTDRPLLPHRKD
jgi:3-hydroxyisobutyrate dehydrogenase